MKRSLVVSVVVGLVLLATLARAGWWSNDESAHEHHHHDDDDTTLGQEMVTCGSMLKLRHVGTSVRLHSHQVSYGSGSGQQSVTGFAAADDANSFWMVRAANGKRCLQGEPIKNGDVIRLQHAATRLNLHSHHHQSPLSRQQEVSCFGPDGNGDDADNWILETDGSPYWSRFKPVYLKHQVTHMYLHSHDVKYRQPIAGQQEITAVPGKNSNCKWITEEGIFFPEREPTTKESK